LEEEERREGRGGVRWSFLMPYFYHDKVEKEKGV
jgi:hypothetical protein